MKKKFIYIFGFIIILITSYLILNVFIGSDMSQKIFSNINIQTKEKFKKILFPYRHFKFLEDKIERLEYENYNLNHEVIAVRNEIEIIIPIKI